MGSYKKGWSKKEKKWTYRLHFFFVFFWYDPIVQYRTDTVIHFISLRTHWSEKWENRDGLKSNRAPETCVDIEWDSKPFHHTSWFQPRNIHKRYSWKGNFHEIVMMSDRWESSGTDNIWISSWVHMQWSQACGYICTVQTFLMWTACGQKVYWKTLPYFKKSICLMSQSGGIANKSMESETTHGLHIWRTQKHCFML